MRTAPRSITAAAFAAALAFTGCDTAGPAAGPDLAAPSTADARAVDTYIVVFKPGVANTRSMARQLSGGKAEHVYQNAIQGFSAPLSAKAAAALERNPNVAYVERDHVVMLAPPPGKGPGGGGDGGGTSSQSTPYGITRVNGGVSGAGLTACVVDSGIDLDHPDLNVDVAASRSFLGGRDADDPDDGNGHGTHVAGTIGALDNDQGVIGVAAGASVVSVRVLDRRGSGAYSGVIAGVDYVASGAAGCTVANLSLGGPASQALDDAVVAAGAAGVKMVLAAGNESQDAGNVSPARAAARHNNVYAISAVDVNDRFASFSNYGSVVDYAAPGVAIESTWKSGGYSTISGTSMASPHAAGVLLLGAARTDGSALNDPDGNADPIIVR